MRRELFPIGFLTLTLTTTVNAAATVGSDAPAVEPSEWLNAAKGMSWNSLKGRVVLLEKWATY